MIVWQTAKRWQYKGRSCEIQRSSVGDATQYRGLVEVETGVPDRALSSWSAERVRRTRRPKRRRTDEYRTWLYFGWSGADLPRSGDAVSPLRERVNELAEHVAKTEL